METHLSRFAVDEREERRGKFLGNWVTVTVGGWTPKNYFGVCGGRKKQQNIQN
jgi:hypothetical protein